MKPAISPERWRHLEHQATSRPNRPSAEPPISRVLLISTVWARFCFTSLLVDRHSWARMFFMLFIRLQRIRRRVCGHSFLRSTATWRQLLLAVWRAILRRATNRPGHWPLILTFGCDRSRFGRGAQEFLLAAENGCDGIQLRRCCWRC